MVEAHMIRKILLACMVPVALAGCGEEPPTPAPVEPLTEAEITKCQDVIDSGKKIGLIRGSRYAGRIDVDELKWAQLPASAKEGLLWSVACVTYRLRPSALNWDQGSFAYGWRSGKRLAMFSNLGFRPE